MKKCIECDKDFNTKEVARVYGKESRVLEGGFCSAICYTQNYTVEVKTARELLLDRIDEIKKRDGFGINNMRWLNSYVGSEDTHICVLDFNTLTDPELVEVFEHIVRQYNKQM